MIAFEKSVGAVVFRSPRYSSGEAGRKDPVKSAEADHGASNNKIKYLLLNYRGGHWDFPKGHSGKNENDEETLRREVAEETGIQDLEIIPDFKKQIRYFYRAKDNEKIERKQNGKSINIFKKAIFYLAETKTEDVQTSFEHLGYVWLNYSDALERLTYKNAKNVLKKAQEFLEELS